MTTNHQTQYPNGKPVLLDHRGEPIPTRPDTGRPDGSARIGGIALPHVMTFVARQGGAFQTYWGERYDEALRQSREDAEVMRRDAYLMALVNERQLSVSGLPWHIEVPDSRDPRQRRVRDGLTQIINGIPSLRRIIWWMTEALWYGRYGVEVEWDWSTFLDRPGQAQEAPPSAIPGMPAPPKKPESGKKTRCLTVRKAFPVNGDKIGFQHDHTPYVLIGGQYADQLPDADIISTTQGRAMTLRGSWRERFIIHRHLMEDADYFAPDQAGAIHGVGIRSKLFWLNWLKLEWLGNITDFFDRVGMGFMMWRYPAGNEAAKQEAMDAAINQSSRAHVLVPVWGEQGREALTGVERVDVATAGSEALVKLIDYIDKQLERYVVGQSGSSRSSAAGIGNEAASEFLQQTKNAITMQDAHLLAVSMTGEEDDPGLVSVIKQYTFPWADFPARWVFDVERPESKAKLESGKTLVELGVKIREDEFREAAGYAAPADGDKLVEPPAPPGGMPGMPPGMPGAPPGAPGADPNADPNADPASSPEGDFLAALKMARDGTPLKYDWQKEGFAYVSKTGMPMYRWYNPEMHQSRVQNVKPGGGKRADPTQTAPGEHGRGVLDVGRATRKKLVRALSLMFPGGWLKLSGLPALAGVKDLTPVPADVSRDAEGALVVAIRAPGGRHELTLHPDGVLSMELPAREALDLAGRALELAGVDMVSFDEDAVDLREASVSVPSEIARANRRRRKYRLKNAEKLMRLADQIEPRHESKSKKDKETPEKDTESPDTPEKHARHAAIAEVAARLESAGYAGAAREALIAYARRLGGGQ